MKKKFLGKVGAITLSATMLAGGILPSISYASNGIVQTQVIDGIKIETLKETRAVKKVRSTENGITTIAEFNKTANVLTITEDGKEPIVIDIDKAVNEYLESQNTTLEELEQAQVQSRGVIREENTYTNYEYTISKSGSTESWQIRTPKGSSLTALNKKTKTYNSSTKSNLNSFKSKVDQIDKLELQILGGITLTFFFTCATVILAGTSAGAVATGLAAVGAAGTTANRFLTLFAAQKDAKLYYGRL